MKKLLLFGLLFVLLSSSVFAFLSVGFDKPVIYRGNNFRFSYDTSCFNGTGIIVFKDPYDGIVYNKVKSFSGNSFVVNGVYNGDLDGVRVEFVYFCRDSFVVKDLGNVKVVDGWWVKYYKFFIKVKEWIK